MGGPDVEHAGWATDAPGSRLRRRRNPLLGVLAVVLLAGGLAAMGVGIAGLAASGPDEEDVVARGVIAALDGPDTAVARFVAPGERSYTVWMDVDGVLDNHEDAVIASASCAAVRRDGSTKTFRGSRQGHAEVIGDQATVGTFDSREGTVVVRCRHERWGRRAGYSRLRHERAFLVVPGRPGAAIMSFVLLFGGIVVALLAWPVSQRWNAGRLRRAGGVVT